MDSDENPLEFAQDGTPWGVREVLGKMVINTYKKALKAFDTEFKFQISVIVDEILKEVRPFSVYLIGSFGRNEGSLYLSEGEVSPLRDYDILIVVNEYIEDSVISRITRSIHKRLGLSDPYSKIFKFKGFTVWITQVTLNDINVLPMLKFYELKKASKLLWGDDIRDGIHITLEDISPYNCILILFSKVEGLLGLLDIDALRKRSDEPEKVVDFVYECLKTYVEVGTCLSLLANVYEPSFLQRCVKLSRNFSALFPDLEKMCKALPSVMVTYAYRRLLIDDSFLNNLDLMKLLEGTLNNLSIVIWYYVRKTYKIYTACPPTSPYAFDSYVKKLNTKPLESLFDHYIKAKLGFRSKVVRELAIRLYLRYTLLRFMVKGRQAGYRIKPSIVFARNGNIMMRLWSLGFFLLNSIKDDFEINESMLHAVSNRLCEIIDFNYIQRARTLKETPELSFSQLQKTIVDLLDIADKIFHRKG